MSRYLRPILTLILAATAAQSAQNQTVVFVCEHGSAKSVIAAAYFNRLAESKGLPYRAVSRGLNPDSEIPANIRTGMSADGFDIRNWKPQLLGDADIHMAKHVVTLSCELPKTKSIEPGKLIEWANLPAVSDGYPEARAEIVRRVEGLLKQLSSARR